MIIHQPLVRNQYLLKLLEGNGSTYSMQLLAKDLQINFGGNYFFVALVSFHQKMDVDSIHDKEKVINSLIDITYKNCIGYGTELIHDNALVLIVNMKGNSEKERKYFAEDLTDHVKRRCKNVPTIGIGKAYKGIDRINTSFIEANVAVNYNPHFNNEIILFEDTIPPQKEKFWYHMESQIKFAQSLKQGDHVVAKEALGHIISDLKKRNTSMQMLRFMSFDILDTILKNMSELELFISKEDVHHLIESKTLGYLEEKVHVLVDDICQQVRKKEKIIHNHLNNDILEYIHAHFTSYHLSLGSIAAEFQLTTSYLSRLIKEKTGFNFTQYIWELRNTEFKKQLIQTEKPIKDIIEHVGYMDAANFSRTFKRKEGLTPGQYRKNIKDNA